MDTKQETKKGFLSTLRDMVSFAESSSQALKSLPSMEHGKTYSENILIKIESLLSTKAMYYSHMDFVKVLGELLEKSIDPKNGDNVVFVVMQLERIANKVLKIHPVVGESMYAYLHKLAASIHFKTV